MKDQDRLSMEQNITDSVSKDSLRTPEETGRMKDSVLSPQEDTVSEDMLVQELNDIGVGMSDKSQIQDAADTVIKHVVDKPSPSPAEDLSYQQMQKESEAVVSEKGKSIIDTNVVWEKDSVQDKGASDDLPVLIEMQTVEKGDKALMVLEKGKKETTYFGDINLLIALFSIVLVVFIKVFYGKFLSAVVKSIYNYSLVSKMIANKNVLVKRVFLVLNLVFFLNIGLFITEILDFYNIYLEAVKPYYFTLLISLFVFLVYLSKRILLFLTGWVFNQQSLFYEYNEIIFLINKNIGIFILPLILVIPFVPSLLAGIFIYLAIGVIALLFLLRFLKGISLAVTYRVSFFYFSLYVILIELLPVVLLGKLFYDMNHISPLIYFS